MKFNPRTFIFIRESQNLTKTELAHKLSISRKTIEAWESEKSAPNRKNIQAVSDLLEVDIEVFRYSDADFYNYLMQHIHPAEFPLLIRDLFCEYYRLDKDKEISTKDRVMSKLAIFDRLLPLLHQGHQANLDEATDAQIKDEELIRDASPYDAERVKIGERTQHRTPK